MPDVPLDEQSYFPRLRAVFGGRFLVGLHLIQHILKGFVCGGGGGGLAGTPVDFILRDYKVSGTDLQVYRSATGIPWSIKPLIGLLSDRISLFGYHKRPYMFISTLLALLAMVVLTQRPDPLIVSLVACFLIFLQCAVCDLLSEGMYAAKLKSHPKSGPDLVTFVWVGISIFRTFAVLLVGPLIDSIGPFRVYWIGVPFAALVLPLVVFNLLGEARVDADQASEENVKPKFWEMTCLSLVTGLGGLFLAIYSIIETQLHRKCIVAGVLGIVVVLLFTFLTRPLIAKQNLFMFIQNCMHFGIHGASFYFFTDTPEQYPEGPHFGTVFYTTTLGIVASICSLVGMYLYNRFMKHWHYQWIFSFSSVLCSLVGLFNIIVYTRFNVTHLGIPDRIFVISSAALGTVLGEFNWMPAIVLLSQSCPDNLESTMYALLAGASNLSSSLSDYFGAMLLYHLGVTPDGSPNEGPKFARLWEASLWSCLAPLVPLVLVRFLIPNARQTDSLIIDEPSDPCHGSLLRRIQSSWFSKGRPHIFKNVELEEVESLADTTSDLSEDHPGSPAVIGRPGMGEPIE
ncbi:hypothetical protein FOL47_006181 [Perkinsus chesapeaki]|uniref:Uncharacterized protein n=1 Tax=Perkinsus chesapeaki TaxID=330153 RepID=A0A7J6LTJ2_PERCH|nr:hypothetical protein FOL47_006181 [Perkinsus chesapeaki]